uniref:Uncharacterized protein n=1 Tax=Plectus sambesii TaxID=2011161 RepID=A0A914UWL7_9BILA
MTTEITFGWTETTVNGAVTKHPYYVPDGSDESNYVFKIVNYDAGLGAETSDNKEYDYKYGLRKLVFFNNLLVLDVSKQTIEIDPKYELIFVSNTAGLCGLASLSGSSADDMISSRVNGTLTTKVEEFQEMCFYKNDGQHQDGACVSPVCEFSRPQHLRTFDDKQTWLDKGTATNAPLLFIAACDPMLNPLPACWEGRINNFALTVVTYAPSDKIFGNGVKDNDAYEFIFMFCISETTVCEKTIKISLSWDQFKYSAVEKFPFSYQVQGKDFFTIDSFFFGSDEQSSVNSAGYSSSGWFGRDLQRKRVW